MTWKRVLRLAVIALAGGLLAGLVTGVLVTRTHPESVYSVVP
ncbi:hypothetical protein [Actinorhabdospora filicis]|nr:hypothetical protein [Actinorhabdospora filicis]